MKFPAFCIAIQARNGGDRRSPADPVSVPARRVPIAKPDCHLDRLRPWRKVAIDNVRLRLLPRPGFDLEGLVIYDDPAFSAEPMIRAQEVSAAIRFRSLLRGRLEIATLSATEPSINLVRNSEGRWNLASLLERNAQIPAAPTRKRASERRPAFPISKPAMRASISKLGRRKILRADRCRCGSLAGLREFLGSAHEGSARAHRFQSHRYRTAADQRHLAARPSLRLTPVHSPCMGERPTRTDHEAAERKRPGMARRSQFYGEPIGHSGGAADRERDRIDGFRRYDIVGNENVRLGTGCTGQYNAVTSTLADLLCESPVGGGMLRMRGTCPGARRARLRSDT